jgi:hypothetical protein
VFILLLYLLLIGFVVAVVLGAGTLLLQARFNESPPEFTDLVWRAPAAGAAVALFFGIWCLFAYRSPGNFGSLFDFSAGQDTVFDELIVPRDGRKVVYKRERDPQGRLVYLDQARRPIASRPEKVIVKENGQEVEFLPERDERGMFKTERGQFLRYLDSRKRVMLEGQLGQLTTPRTGLAIFNLFLNLFHLGVWFACLWLLMRFTWTQALGLAVALWLGVTLFAVSPLLGKCEALGKQRAQAVAGEKP